ncbi:hypothetical protein N7478_001786 [Penicillium angulare]|uniref:uncharacterized protein n=1 Tax=Penicillium angulare TaxID=116970 RepID=UPI0025417707|nr:uncharacterized protein N7478_001786 [Penicillium angulare]KAJ5288756.1 hypothetical protein N7478_001786 [Penicillium angulare]
MSSPAATANRDGHNAGRRAREVYRYFRPERLDAIDEDITPDNQDQNDFQFPDRSRSRSPNALQTRPQPAAAPMNSMPDSLILGDANSTLGSFAQLAALRLGMDRVFISVSDRDSQFIIAQAGQTTESTDKYDLLSKGLYNGCSTLDVSNWNMCQDTVALPASNRTTGDYNFIISNDMSLDERYQHLPLVKEDPSFRFYAGTPLTTDSNINVGCFFVLDTKPHPEFSNKDRESMGHMAMLIMDFLKVSRQASEGRRAARLSKGISHFVDGRSSFEVSSGSQGTLSRQTSNASRDSRNSRHRKAHSVSSHRSRSSSSGYSAASNPNGSDPSSQSSYDTSSSDNGSQSKHDGVDTNLGNWTTFRRAANIIRESLELGGDSGVVFLEAGNDPMVDLNSDSDFSSSAETGKHASILAVSTEEDTFGPNEEVPISYPVANMDEEFLHRLLNRYQKGNIWSLHRDGQLSSSDSEDGSPRDYASRINYVRSKRPKKWKTKENKMLNDCFLGASQVMFVPLWSSANSQWFGGCFCWNNIESNVFDQSVELGSLLSFGSSVMVECSRVESLISDRHKADFLGSISHELRSPLHGILAAAEILQTTELNPYQGSLMDTINACGRTLLDTMNQVLDYSKILSLEKRFRHLDRRRTTTLELKNMHRSATHLDVYVTTDLSTLAEEVVDGVSLGHYHNQHFSSSSDLLSSLETKHSMTARSTSTHPKVKVTIDIAPNDWVYHIPPGALRRIIMNIFSNAMKYTEAGQVSFRLEVEDSSRHNTQEDLVTLTVSDTGRGISEEFLRSRLFVPFVQEDSLAAGSGLGLSIVRSLIKPIGGTINFQSQIGKGTTVKVSLPLIRPGQELEAHFGSLPSPTETRERKVAPNDAKILRQTHSGKTVSIINAKYEDVSSLQSWSTVCRYLTDWFGLEIVHFCSDSPADLILFDGAPLDKYINGRNAGNTNALIFSNEYVGGDSTRATSSIRSCNVHIINRPWGPHKLARFIKKCLDQKRSFNLPSELAILPKPPAHVKIEKQPIQSPKLEEGFQETNQVPAVEVKKVQPNTQPKETTQPESMERGARILVVEDNKINLSLILAFLKKHKSAYVDSAENGNLALDAVKADKQGYDIIFMDISMPLMNGFEATRAIRAFERGRKDQVRPSTIVALTGLSSIVDEMKAIESGMDLFLTKPVAFQEVKKILDRWNEEHGQGST